MSRNAVANALPGTRLPPWAGGAGRRGSGSSAGLRSRSGPHALREGGGVPAFPAQSVHVRVTHCRYEPTNQRPPYGVPTLLGIFFLKSSSAERNSPQPRSPPPFSPSPPSSPPPFHTRCSPLFPAPPSFLRRSSGAEGEALEVRGALPRRALRAGTRFASRFTVGGRGGGRERRGAIWAVRRFMRRRRQAGRTQCEASRVAGRSPSACPVQPSAPTAPRSQARPPW